MYIHVSTSNFLRDSPFVLVLEIKVQLSVPWHHNIIEKFGNSVQKKNRSASQDTWCHGGLIPLAHMQQKQTMLQHKGNFQLEHN